MSKRKNLLRGPKTGRPEKDIDWELVEKLATYDCSGAQIAARLNIHPHTLYERIQIKYGITYTDFSNKFSEKGNTLLLEKQFERALDPEKPSETMLVWLGKQKLKQRDKQPDEEPKAPTLVININRAPYSQSDSNSI